MLILTHLEMCTHPVSCVCVGECMCTSVCTCTRVCMCTGVCMCTRGGSVYIVCQLHIDEHTTHTMLFCGKHNTMYTDHTPPTHPHTHPNTYLMSIDTWAACICCTRAHKPPTNPASSNAPCIRLPAIRTTIVMDSTTMSGSMHPTCRCSKCTANTLCCDESPSLRKDMLYSKVDTSAVDMEARSERLASEMRIITESNTTRDDVGWPCCRRAVMTASCSSCWVGRCGMWGSMAWRSLEVSCMRHDRLLRLSKCCNMAGIDGVWLLNSSR